MQTAWNRHAVPPFRAVLRGVAGVSSHLDGVPGGASIRDSSLHNPVNPDAARAFARLVMG